MTTQYEEHYIVEHVKAEGKVDVEQYDNPSEAIGAYNELARVLSRGEKINLHRYSSVVLASSARAK
ncbi:hypothetical protein SAM23877_6168 [Streptomyces ambofaciens ATCC 23877]|uniref:Uncharacterized protein n=1 Tax=Streptomyces ambofaciens (strain ATCC 23877 / 3486 / DSM 40053 / JCM 4204 / NBRC 12836 / NRRL B-2516) TaxID=278992 RepID=A0A0K2B1Y1_STRA7|nr:hypothetical protein [Streptomyces ambofaciens]AKZ59213.1 hypothetical protein SAM23877_6168 [Streptomyces ambofaciens ATCC 23877]WNA15406.1 hypothetical protein SAMYPH_75 [Streptomyces phage Samy]